MALDLLRSLPAVSRVLEHRDGAALLERYSRDYVVDICREVLDSLRHAIVDGQAVDADALHVDAIVIEVERRLADQETTGLPRVINATGTVLHTNLGRALLARAAAEAAYVAATRPVALEYDVVHGERGRRERTCEALLSSLTGAEAATVVNNNAAAVLLLLNTLAQGKEVIVSRGELIEIGGAFRIPEIMERSGATLREVGTTNRTHTADYEQAISDRTGLILKVHRSNYKVVGFTADVELPALVAIGKARGIPVAEDLGSGALVDLSRYGLPKEPVVSERLALGVDLVTFSGDKLLGGPQAGIIAGRTDLVRAIDRNPLHRAVRCGKLTIAALEATLRLYRQSASLERELPTLRAFTRPIEEIEQTAARASTYLASALGPGFRVSTCASTSQVGSGALPTDEIPTVAVVVEHDSLAPQAIAERFRRAQPPIIGRVADGRFLLDARAIEHPLDLVPRWAAEPTPAAMTHS